MVKKYDLWHDPCYENELLANNSEARAIIILPVNAKVAELIENYEWGRLIVELLEGELKQKIKRTPINQYL